VTATAPTSGSTDPVGRLEDVRALSDLLPRFVRIVAAHKQHLASEGRDRAAHVLLLPIDRLGPLRQSSLAELMHSDPSTVSRQVALLVERGLVQRVADEADGRASRLLITDAGKSAIEDLCAERETRLDALTAEWDRAELLDFTRLLARLLDDLEAALPGSTGPFPATPAPRGSR
jgi:DNA-binding MarR family transcriptional regulator